MKNKKQEIEVFRKEVFKKYKNNDFIKDIESIFIAYDKKEVRKIGLNNLIEEIKNKCKIKMLDKELRFLKKLEVFKLPITCDTCKIVCPEIGKRFQKLEYQRDKLNRRLK